MTEETAYRIKYWLEDGVPKQVRDDAFYFAEGLALLEKVMTNVYYLQNIRRKGAVKGIETVKYELGKKIKGFEFQVSSFKLPSETGDGRRETEDGKSSKFQVSPPDGRAGSSKLEIPKQVRDDTSTSSVTARFILRNEFPFLMAKDCPEEFKILVNDMITAHTVYVDGHEKLYHVVNKDNDQCFDVAKLVVENYLNNQLIWEELKHYKKTGELLGNHEIFAKRNRTVEIENMEAAELMKLYRNLPRNINYYQNLIKDDYDSEKQKERLDKIDWYNFELKIVKRLLQIGPLRRAQGAKRKKKSSKFQVSSSKLKKKNSK